ncbi:MAG: adenylate/guanylate cyclase domain-containing protein [Firmicutes bacterium]|nr:adenylate/guanylate cyclase domain-containing protein [Bacillota bacterium]
MEASYKHYDFIKSFDRVNEILNASDTNFAEVDIIPSRDELTFTNGFYVNCSAVFADIRDSSNLPTKYQRPTLARIYRSYISEVVAVINGAVSCKEITISGDCASGIFDAAFKWQIAEVFGVAYRINSLVRVLNYRLKKRGIEPISVGIGMSYGRALMIKAGYKGSGINEVVWMGDVVNEASKLAGYGNATWNDHPLMVSSSFHSNLDEHSQGLLSWNWSRSCYHGNVVDSAMEEWYQENCS